MGNSLSNHSMVLELYTILMLLFVRKSAPNIRSYLILPSNTCALCCSITWFLSSSSNRIAWRMTISFAMHEPASVLMLQAFSTRHGLHDLGRHFWLIQVTVEPGSKSTFNRVRERTPEMVSHSKILRGVRLFLSGRAAVASCGASTSSSASITGNASLTGKWGSRLML
jgi:hypothetical protein